MDGGGGGLLSKSSRRINASGQQAHQNADGGFCLFCFDVIATFFPPNFKKAGVFS